MTSYRYRMSSTFECVDSEPEYIEAEESNYSSGKFYFVRSGCTGELFNTEYCPPYDDDKQLTCVVCTK